MERRYAILDDNQRLLEQRLASLKELLPPLIAGRACAAMVIGSVAQGTARDESDIDLLLVLRQGDPERSDYDWWDHEVLPHLGSLANRRFTVQPVIVGRPSLATGEPNLRRAMKIGIVLWDPDGIFHDQSRPGT
jgi:predicted nucleotidyltransferase